MHHQGKWGKGGRGLTAAKSRGHTGHEAKGGTGERGATEPPAIDRVAPLGGEGDIGVGANNGMSRKGRPTTSKGKDERGLGGRARSEKHSRGGRDSGGRSEVFVE